MVYLLASTFILLNLFGAVMGHSLTAAGGMEINVAAVKADVAEVKADIAEVKADIAGVKADIAGVKADVIKYRRENAETAEVILAQARELHARIIAELRQLQSATARSSSSPESPEVYARDGSPGP